MTRPAPPIQTLASKDEIARMREDIARNNRKADEAAAKRGYRRNPRIPAIGLE